MKPSSRRPVSKGRSAGQFRRDTTKTKAANVRGPAMRGGWRF